MNDNSSPQFYLASQSPRRRELLLQIKASFSVINLEMLEPAWLPSQDPLSYVQQLATQKAQQGWAVHQNLPCLGADTVVVQNGQVFGKPRDQQHASEILQQLSGTSHQVLTAISVCSATQCLSQVVTTDVEFSVLTPAMIAAYWQTGEPHDKAGAYAIQGQGGLFVKRINGSYSAVVGLPLFETAELLRQFAINVGNG